MTCPKCNTAALTQVTRSGVFGPKVMRTRRCNACAVEWPTEEVRIGECSPVATAAQQCAPVASPAHSPSDPKSEIGFSLTSESGSESGSRRSSGDRRSDGPSLFEAALEQFRAAWEAQYRASYVVTPGDRAQLGRLLKGLKPAEARQLPVAFANYCSGLDRFEGEKVRHSLKFFCASGGFNKYRTSAKTAGYSDRELRSSASGDEWVAEMNGRGK